MQVDDTQEATVPMSPDINDSTENNEGQKIITILLIVIMVLLTFISILLFLNITNDRSSDTSAPTSVTEPTKETPAVNEQAQKQEPNVLFIILDDIGLDYFPGYLEDAGFEKARMPVMESLMENGYIFTNLNTYAMCSPTRASLISGFHGVDTGVLDPGRTAYLDTKWQSIHNELKDQSAGAITSSVIGKWHVMKHDGDISHPNLFTDYYAGIPDGNHDSYFEWDKIINGVEVGSDVYATSDLTNEAIDWINQQDGQWFTWLAYTAPHDPIHLPPANLHTYDLSGDERDIKRNGDQYFMAMLESVDTEIGRLLDSLSEEDRANTYVIVIGDNGTGGKTSQTPFKEIGAKGTLHVGGIHTPMIVYSPYQNGGGTEVDELVSTIDFFPSILDIFNLKSNLDLPGNSFYPLTTETDGEYKRHKYLYAQSDDAVTVRSDTHRLIRYNDKTEELYDLTSDFFEENNLLNNQSLDSETEVTYKELTNALDQYLQGNY